MPALMRRVVNQPTLRMNDLAVAKTDRLLSQPLLASQTKSISRRTQHQIAITKPQFQSDPSSFQSPSSFPNTTKPSQLHNSFFPSLCTNFFHTIHKFPSSGQTFSLSNCLSIGPVGPLVYLHSLSMPRKHSWMSSSSGYCLSPQWPVKDNQLVGSLEGVKRE